MVGQLDKVWVVRTTGPEESYGAHYGGAVCISRGGYLLTVEHLVVEPPRQIYVRGHGCDHFRPATFVRSLRGWDVAIIKIETSDESETFPWVPLKKSINLDTGVRVFSHGHSSVQFSTRYGCVAYPFLGVSRGELTSLLNRTVAEDEGKEKTYGSGESLRTVSSMYPNLTAHIFTDLPLIQVTGIGGRPGISGCPVFTVENEELIGLNCFSFTETRTSLSFSSSVTDGSSFLVPMDIMYFAVVDLADQHVGIPRVLRDDTVQNLWEFGEEDAVRVTSRSIVTVLTHNTTDDMIPKHVQKVATRDYEYVCPGSGIIIDCQNIGDGGYNSSILVPACLFKRSKSIKPNDILIDVYVPDGRFFKGELLACDFHHNLAVVNIKSDYPLQSASLRGLDDSNRHEPHPNLHKISSVTKIITLRRSFLAPYCLQVDHGAFCDDSGYEICSYLLKDATYKNDHGGAVINYSGEVIGILFYNSILLPSNIVSKWWDYYKTHRELCITRLGAGLMNSKSGVRVDMSLFGNSAPGSRVKYIDYVVECDGELVRSKLELTCKFWDFVGKTVEFKVTRKTREGSSEFTVFLTFPREYGSHATWPKPSCVMIPAKPQNS